MVIYGYIWLALVLITPKTYDNHMCVRQTDKDNKIVQRENISLRTKISGIP